MSNGKGKDFYSDLVDQSPIERQVTVYGNTRTVWFKRLTAGQRIQINSGVKFRTLGGKTESTVDMADYMKRQLQMVAFSNVTESGERIFKTPEDVRDLDGALFDALLKHAEEINKEDSNEGKDLSRTPTSASS